MEFGGVDVHALDSGEKWCVLWHLTCVL